MARHSKPRRTEKRAVSRHHGGATSVPGGDGAKRRPGTRSGPGGKVSDPGKSLPPEEEVYYHPNPLPVHREFYCLGMGPPRVELSIGGHLIEMMVDSGADLTMVSSAVAKELGLRVGPLALPPFLRGMGGAQIEVEGVATVEVTFHGKSTTATILVIGGKREAVVGLDLAGNLRLVVDLKSKFIFFREDVWLWMSEDITQWPRFWITEISPDRPWLIVPHEDGPHGEEFVKLWKRLYDRYGWHYEDAADPGELTGIDGSVPVSETPDPTSIPGPG